jgi:hypothetical protein
MAKNAVAKNWDKPIGADGKRHSGTDTFAPSQVTGLTAEALTSSSIELNWSAATDTGGSGLSHYLLRRDGGSPVDVGLNLTYPATGLSMSTEYDFEVAAVDSAGNVGAYSSVASATTLGGGTGPTGDGMVGDWQDDVPIEFHFETGNSPGTSSVPAEMFMSDFRNAATHGGTVSVTDTLHGELRTPAVGGSPLIYHGQGQAYVGDYCVNLYNQMTQRPRAYEFDFDPVDEFLLIYYLKYPIGSRLPGATHNGQNVPANQYPTGSQSKHFWIHAKTPSSGGSDAANDATGNNDGPDLCLPTYNSGWSIAGNQGGGMMNTGAGWSPRTLMRPDGVWNRLVFHITEGRACYTQLSNPVDGIVATATNIIETALPLSSHVFGSQNPSAFDVMRIGGWCRWDTPDCYPLVDNVYFAGGVRSFNRVEIGEASTYGACKQLQVCEIVDVGTDGAGTPTWTVMARRGPFSQFTGLYAYPIIDSTRGRVQYAGAEGRLIS